MHTIHMGKAAVAALALAFLAGCDTDKDVLPDPTPDPHANTVVAAAMHFFFGAAGFHLDSNYTDTAGTLLNFDAIKFYMAKPFFLDDVGDTVATFPDKYLLIDVAEGGTIRTIGELGGHLHIMGCGLGVDVVANHADPTTAPAPLNDATMHWGWNPAQGYKFLVLEGKYDSDGSGTITGTDMDFSLHCATDAVYTQAEIEVHTDANSGGNLILHFHLDIKETLYTIDVAAQPFAQGGTPTNVALMHNLSTAIVHAN